MSVVVTKKAKVSSNGTSKATKIAKAPKSASAEKKRTSTSSSGSTAATAATAAAFEKHKSKHANGVIFGMNARSSVVVSLNKGMTLLEDAQSCIDMWKDLKTSTDKLNCAAVGLWLLDPDIKIYTPLTILSCGPLRLAGPSGGYSTAEEFANAYVKLPAITNRALYLGSEWSIRRLESGKEHQKDEKADKEYDKEKKFKKPSTVSMLHPADCVWWVSDSPPPSENRKPAIFPILQHTMAALFNEGVIKDNIVHDFSDKSGYTIFTDEGKTSLYPRKWFSAESFEQRRKQIKEFEQQQEIGQKKAAQQVAEIQSIEKEIRAAKGLDVPSSGGPLIEPSSK